MKLQKQLQRDRCMLTNYGKGRKLLAMLFVASASYKKKTKEENAGKYFQKFTEFSFNVRTSQIDVT